MYLKNFIFIRLLFKCSYQTLSWEWLFPHVLPFHISLIYCTYVQLLIELLILYHFVSITVETMGIYISILDSLSVFWPYIDIVIYIAHCIYITHCIYLSM